MDLPLANGLSWGWNEVDKNQDAQLAEKVTKGELVVNVKDYGAKGDGVTDDTLSIQNAMDFIVQRGIGGTLYFPSGNYVVTGTINYYTSTTKGITIKGDGVGATIIEWHGTAGTLFTNEKTIANQWQYNTHFADFTLTARVGSVSAPVVGSVGLYVDMTRNHWYMNNVRITGFETGMIVGVHSEAGKLSKVGFYYNSTGLNLYGDQADATVLDSVWFVGNKLRGLIISSPRTVVDKCMFVFDQNQSDTTQYIDIQICYQKVKDSDKIKSTYLSTSIGNGGSFSSIINSFFEGSGISGQPAILIEDVDVTTSNFPGLTIENNYFALYDRDTAVKITNPKNKMVTRNNKLQANNAAYLFDHQGVSGNSITYEEPFINNVFKTSNQKWMFGAKQDEFNKLKLIANSVLFSSPGWAVQNPHYSRNITIDCDYDGLGSTQITTSSTDAGSILARFNIANCPVGMVYLSTKVKADISSTMNVSVNRGTSTVIFAKNYVNIGDEREIIFGFYNDTLDVINIDLLSVEVMTGNIYLSEVLIKHDDNSKQSYSLWDTISGQRFTNRSNQVMSIPNKTPYKEIVDYANPVDRWYYGKHYSTTISNVGGYAAGATSINVSDASGIAVGDYLFFKNFTSNVSFGFQGTETSGNKVTGITGNTITLATGLTYALLDASKVLSCQVYKKSSATAL